MISKIRSFFHLQTSCSSLYSINIYLYSFIIYITILPKVLPTLIDYAPFLQQTHIPISLQLSFSLISNNHIPNYLRTTYYFTVSLIYCFDHRHHYPPHCCFPCLVSFPFLPIHSIYLSIHLQVLQDVDCRQLLSLLQ